MTVGNITALVQDDVKRMLAYSRYGVIDVVVGGFCVDLFYISCTPS